MDHSISSTPPSEQQAMGSRTTYTGVTNQPSATSSLRRVYHDQAGTGHKTPTTPDERTALLGGLVTPPDLERGAAPKGTGESCSNTMARHQLILKCPP